ncbi:hypothetical protein K0A97_02060 [Patescibacteria group bacterium]|nr:hypothetical protein [Patescibacteria group bacterium]
MSKQIDMPTVSYLLGILSIVLSFSVPFASLICAIIGLNKSTQLNLKESKKLNLIGLILSIAFGIVSIIGILMQMGDLNFPI